MAGNQSSNQSNPVRLLRSQQVNYSDLQQRQRSKVIALLFSLSLLHTRRPAGGGGQGGGVSFRLIGSWPRLCDSLLNECFSSPPSFTLVISIITSIHPLLPAAAGGAAGLSPGGSTVPKEAELQKQRRLVVTFRLQCEPSTSRQ